MSHRLRVACLAALVPLAAASACAPAQVILPAEVAPAVAAGPALLHGIVAAAFPVAGATVRLVRLDGAPIPVSGGAATTNAAGAYVLHAADLPSAFRVVATGGQVQGKPFAGELRAEVRGYRGGGLPVAPGPLPTLVSAYLDAHPGAGLTQAASAVKAFLAIPPHVDLVADVPHLPAAFDPAAFAGAADAQGGHVALARALIAELDAGGKHPFVRPYHLRDLSSFITEGLVKRLGEAMLSAAADRVGDSALGQQVNDLKSGILGQALSLIGFPTTDANKFQDIQDGLTELGTDIADLKSAYDDAATSILTSQASGTYANYEATTLLPLLAANDHVDATIADAALAGSPLDRKDLLADLDVYIDEHYSNVLQAWNNALCGSTGSGDGAIVLYDKLVNAPTPYFYTYDQAKQVQTWWNAWDVAQFSAVRILYSRMVQKKASDAEIGAMLGRYRDNRTKQLGMLRGVLQQTDSMSLGKYDGLAGAAAKVQLNALPGQAVDPAASGASPAPGAPMASVVWTTIVQKQVLAGNGTVASPSRLWRTTLEHDRLGARILLPVAQWAVAALPPYQGVLTASRTAAQLATGIPNLTWAQDWQPGGLSELGHYFHDHDPKPFGVDYEDAYVFPDFGPKFNQLDDSRPWYWNVATKSAGVSTNASDACPFIMMQPWPSDHTALWYDP
ncbi:MAG: hypothetical protein JWM80_2544 [Cyanobacteria bacterium RYN_339]|nr:hypothetical protein [Cyanobacteria bacterium RYN_339]